MEIWKDIEGFEGLYQVSNMGNVRSLDRFIVCKNGKIRKYKGKTLQPILAKKNGYYTVSLVQGIRREVHYIHRLVALYFVENLNPKKYNVVNHIDENKLNNIYTNLEWCDTQYNTQYSTYKQCKKIYCIELDKKFDSQVEANLYLNKKRNSTNICECLKGRRKTAYGYHWEFI